jgi:NADH dehydrogenase
MTAPKQIVVLGGGFAGLWSAVGAARKVDELGLGPDDVRVTLVNRDAFHTIRVRCYEADLKVRGVANVFAAGDAARAVVDDAHASVMSCQHGRPMGRFAGHNVVCDLVGLPLLPLRIDWYVTVLDLGPAGAVYTTGWDRAVLATGAAARRTKQTINCHRIYPPLDRNRREILDAAPVVQVAPRTDGSGSVE